MTVRTFQNNLLTIELESDDKQFDVGEVLDELMGKGQPVTIRTMSLCCVKPTTRSVDLSIDKSAKQKALPLLLDSADGQPDLVSPGAAANATGFVLRSTIVPPGWMLRVTTGGGEPGAGSCLSVLLGPVGVF